MRRTPDPPAFVDAVHAYLADARDQFNYDQLLHTFTDSERFYRWAAVMDRRHGLEGVRFLSSGCGLGGSVVAYRDAGAVLAIGVEVDEETVRMAALRVADLDGAEVHRYRGGALPFGDHAFGVIESMDVIEHVPDPPAYLAELVRVLATDGVILLVTPNRLWPVEQHLGIAGPPWLPVPFADALFAGLARLRWLPDDRRFRYGKLRGIRLHNLSLRKLRRWATDLGLHLEVLTPEPDEQDWPLPPSNPLAEWLLTRAPASALGLLAPVRTLAVTLRRSPGRRPA